MAITISLHLLRCYFFVFSLVVVSIEKIHQALKTMFDQTAQLLYFFQLSWCLEMVSKHGTLIVLDIFLFNQKVASAI